MGMTDRSAGTGDRESAIAAAERAASTLTGSLGDKPDETPIETNAGSLRGLAAVIANLLAEVKACGGPDCMGRSINGVRLWATQDRLDQEIQRAADATERADRYAAALRTIEAWRASGLGDFAMLVDWQAVASGMRQQAQAALRSESKAETTGRR